MLKALCSKTDSKPFNALKLIICRSKQRVPVSGREHKAGHCLQAFVSSPKGRGERQEACCLRLLVLQAAFSAGLEALGVTEGVFIPSREREAQLEGQGGECEITLLSAGAPVSLLLAAAEPLPTFVGIGGFLGNLS